MIVSFRHRGLERLYELDDGRRLDPRQLPRIKAILSVLDLATGPSDIDIRGLNLHRLRGTRRDTWSVRVSGNWRITFKFEGIDVFDVDLEDYH